MQSGTIIAQRFEIERQAGSGGMGAVYRALDRLTGTPIALKIVRGSTSIAAERFAREARALLELRHPGIVRYVEHGTTAGGRQYLAMEWLDGESLAERLARDGLTIGESVRLAEKIADALAFAHARGFVHRDVKPSNIFLVGGDIDGAKLLDFGLAHLEATSLTAAGSVLGTPGYLAPEQARGSKQIDARADVFSLGCVLFKCLTGRAAYEGDDPVALFAKVVLEDPPRVHDARPDVPPPLDALVSQMLSNEPARRPADGAAVAAALAELRDLDETYRPIPPSLRPALTASELRLVSAIVATNARDDAPAQDAPTWNDFRIDLDSDDDSGVEEPPKARPALAPSAKAMSIGFPAPPSFSVTTAIATNERLLRAVEPHGARLAMLADGSAVATLYATGSATDLATRAARCAISMRSVLPHAQIGLATGRARFAARVPVGEVIDRATHAARSAPVGAPASSPPPSTRQPRSQPASPRRDARASDPPPSPRARRASQPPPSLRDGHRSEPPGSRRFPRGSEPPRARPIPIDELTAALLDARFEVTDAPMPVLWTEREPIERMRTLLGKATPCVGRDRELAALEAVFEEAVAEPVSRVVIVTAPPGVGKSRLRHEFLWRIRESRSKALAAGAMDAAEVWISRGDPMSAGSPFGMIGPALRRAAGVLDGEPIELQRMKLRARIERHLPADDRERVVEFIGELAGVPFPDDASIQLRAARHDPRLMGDQMQRAWEDLLAAECESRPLLLVLEDLHWGDLPSVRLIDGALRNLRDKPLMVLALGRPELSALFPMLWADRGAQEIRLCELTPKACERLVRSVLGSEVSSELVQRIVAQATGNAFYLEELIRAVVEGKSDSMPETVLAMIHARLERLEPTARRVLRAASVFGRVFWVSGVRALLGGDECSADLAACLTDLVHGEFIASRAEARFPGQTEYVFRHTLVGEASYATLTEDDRALGHKLAAEWLVDVGENVAFVLAEHFERGREPARAIGWYRTAAEEALEGNDLASVLQRTEHGIECGASGEELGALNLLKAEAHRWRGETAEAEQAGMVAMQWLPPRSAAWFNAAAQVANARGLLGRYADLEALAQGLCESRASGDSAIAQVVAVSQATGRLMFAGRYAIAESLLSWLEPSTRFSPDDPTVMAWVHRAFAIRAAVLGDPGARLELWRKAAESFERVGDIRNACLQFANLGESYAFVGAYREAEETLREALASAERMGAAALLATAKQQLGAVLAIRGAMDEARAVEEESVALLQVVRSPRMEGMSRVRLAQILLGMGDIEGAEAEARAAVSLLDVAPPAAPHAMATLARVHLAQGRTEDAAHLGAQAMDRLRELGHTDEGEAFVRLVHAEALDAAGARGEAAAAIELARARLLERAATIADPGLRRGFLERVPEHARTLALAAAWSSAAT